VTALTPVLGRRPFGLQIYLIALLCYVGAAFGYHAAFEPNSAKPYFARVGGTLFSRTYIPDSTLYDETYDPSRLDLSAVFSSFLVGDTNQNILAISALSALCREAEFSPFYLNIVLVALAGLFVLGVCLHYKTTPTLPLLVLFLNPSTIYYSQTTTKEIPLLLTTAMFVFALVAIRGAWRVVGVLAVSALTFLFRVQTAIPMLIVFGISYLSAATRRRGILVAVVGLSSILPFLYSSGSLTTDSVDAYRLDAPSVTGWASNVDAGLRRVPFAGLVLLPIRMFQNATEPFPALVFEEFDFGAQCVIAYSIVLAASVVVTWFFVCEFVRVLWRLFFHRETGPRRLDSIVIYTGLFWLMVAINPFVHARYLFNVHPVFALVASINRSSRSAASPDGRALPMPTSGGWSTSPSWIGWGALMAASVAILLFR
jgi:hypothetical protein